jgi:hypothetical protein
MTATMPSLLYNIDTHMSYQHSSTLMDRHVVSFSVSLLCFHYYCYFFYNRQQPVAHSLSLSMHMCKHLDPLHAHAQSHSVAFVSHVSLFFCLVFFTSLFALSVVLWLLVIVLYWPVTLCHHACIHISLSFCSPNHI